MIKKNPSNPVKLAGRPLSLLVFGGLLCLRIPFLTGMILVQGNATGWVEQVYAVGTFLLTAVLIWLERKQLEEFHITPLALVMILCFKPIMPFLEFLMGLRSSPLSFPRPMSFIYLIISIGLLIALKGSGWSWKGVSAREWKGLGWGALAGLGMAIVFSLPMALTLRGAGELYRVSWSDSTIALLRIPQQLGYAAVAEEPLSFWLIVPITGLVFGLLAWRFRSIASSMASHALVNGLAPFISQLLGMLMVH